MTEEEVDFEPDEIVVFAPTGYVCEACGAASPWKLHRRIWADGAEDWWTCDCGRANVVFVGDPLDAYIPAWIRGLE